MKKLLAAALAIVCLIGAPALAQQTVQTPQYTGASGAQTPAAGVAIVAYDSVTGKPCIVGSTATCLLPGGGGGGGGGAVTAAVNSYVDGALATMGLKADAPCASAATSCTEMQRLAKIEQANEDTTTASAVKAAVATFADGWDATQGLTTDGACAGDTTSGCTVEARVQRLIQRLTTINTTLGTPFQAGANIGNSSFGATLSPAVTGPTSALTMTSATTAVAAGSLIATSATAGSVVVPSFAIANSAGGAAIGRLRLSTNDTTSTAWGGVKLQVDLWLAAPTFTNGDRGAFLPATGTANHLAAFICTMSAEYGDGAYAECIPASGSFVIPKLASGTSVFWTLQAVTLSGVTGASKVWTVTVEELN